MCYYKIPQTCEEIHLLDDCSGFSMASLLYSLDDKSALSMLLYTGVHVWQRVHQGHRNQGGMGAEAHYSKH